MLRNIIIFWLFFIPAISWSQDKTLQQLADELRQAADQMQVLADEVRPKKHPPIFSTLAPGYTPPQPSVETVIQPDLYRVVMHTFRYRYCSYCNKFMQQEAPQLIRDKVVVEEVKDIDVGSAPQIELFRNGIKIKHITGYITASRIQELFR